METMNQPPSAEPKSSGIRSCLDSSRLGSCQDAYASHGHCTNLALKAIPARNEGRAGRGPGEGGFINSAPPLAAFFAGISVRDKKGRPPAGVGEHLPLSQHSTKTYCPNLSVTASCVGSASSPSRRAKGLAVIAMSWVYLTLAETLCRGGISMKRKKGSISMETAFPSK